MGFGGDTLVSRIVNGDLLLESQIPDVALEPGDRIVVRARPEARADFTVRVEGEVYFPGTYPITRDNTRLVDVIRKAGGFTEFASIKTSEVIRRSVRREDIGLERLLSYRGGARSEDSLYYNLETDLRLQKEIVNVDFEALFLRGDSTQDIMLRDRDVIRIPSRQSTIYVFGQVSSPGHIPFLSGADIEYYVRQAGGYTDRARPDDMRIVKAKTRQWLSPDDTMVEEGDYIWIPKEIERSFDYYMAIIGQTAAILSVALSIVLLTIQIEGN
jgi:protein involved in polysaccharide export with SLBB domain